MNYKMGQLGNISGDYDFENVLTEYLFWFMYWYVDL